MIPTFLQDAWSALGGAPLGPEAVVVERDCGLPCPLPVADLAVGAVAAHRLAAAELDHTLGGSTPGPVRVDAAHVGVAFQSERHVRHDGSPVPGGFAPLSRFWPTSDGWVRLHGNYEHHRRAILTALGDDPGAAMARTTAAEVEDAVVAAGGVGAAVRSAAEWSAHPAGRAVAAEPLVTLARVGDGPARGVPVERLRVLDLTRVIAGPVGTRTLASYGADVVRVDNPRLPDGPLFDTCSGKRCVGLDLDDAHDLARFGELLATADVLVHGYRPGALDRFGLDGARLVERLPALTVVRLDAWGRSGPWGARRGFDSIVQAATGLADVLRSPDGTPGALPVQALDHGTGHLLAATVLRALTNAARVGGTWHGELSLARSAHWLLTRPGAIADHADDVADPSQFLIDLPVDGGTTTVVSPPGTPPWAHGPVMVGAADVAWGSGS